MSETSDRIFEALVDPERDPEFSYHKMACALREEALERSEILEHAFKLVGPIGDYPGMRSGLVEQVNRARILGLAHQLFWCAWPFERELRAFIAQKTVEHHGHRSQV